MFTHSRVCSLSSPSDWWINYKVIGYAFQWLRGRIPDSITLLFKGLYGSSLSMEWSQNSWSMCSWPYTIQLPLCSQYILSLQNFLPWATYISSASKPLLQQLLLLWNSLLFYFVCQSRLGYPAVTKDLQWLTIPKGFFFPFSFHIAIAGQLQLSSIANYQGRKENRTWGLDKRAYWILQLLLRSSTSTPKKHFPSQTCHATKSAIHRVGKYHPLPGRERVFVNNTIESCIVDLSTMTPHFYFQSSDHSTLSFYFLKHLCFPPVIDSVQLESRAVFVISHLQYLGECFAPTTISACPVSYTLHFQLRTQEAAWWTWEAWES